MGAKEKDEKRDKAKEKDEKRDKAKDIIAIRVIAQYVKREPQDASDVVGDGKPRKKARDLSASSEEDRRPRKKEKKARDPSPFSDEEKPRKKEKKSKEEKEAK